MSILTDTDIVKIIQTDHQWLNKNKLHIFPFSEESLTPIGYDLRVGNTYSSSSIGKLVEIKEGDSINIKPGDTVLICTLETIGMPHDRSLSALIESKVSKVSKGLSHISTTVDPDWNGELLIAIHNPSRNSIQLNFGETFCTIVFLKNISPSTKDCNKQPRRSDILLKEWAKIVREKETEKRKKKTFSRSLQLIILIISSLVGYLLFKNNAGFVAMTALGVAITSRIRPKIED